MVFSLNGACQKVRAGSDAIGHVSTCDHIFVYLFEIVSPGRAGCSPFFLPLPHDQLFFCTMPRKAATPVAADGSEPRRSTRIKDQPKPDPPKKAPAKPKVKKAEGEAPKRGKKRAAEDTNDEEPAPKKVCTFCPRWYRRCQWARPEY